MANPLSAPAAEPYLLGIDRDELIAFTRRLVQAESVNGHEGPAAELIAQQCREAGLQVSLQAVLPGRSNVLAILPGRIDRLGLLLHGHTDTVPFYDMPSPTSGEIQDGYLWGRGSVDQKGGLAAAVYAVTTLARTGYRPASAVALAAVVDEESEHRGSWTLVQSLPPADFAITTEPSELQLQLAHKGTAPIRVDFVGKLAHGSRPWLGINAIDMAARFLLALKQVELKSVRIPGVGSMQASYNTGLIQGGTQYNNVADQCSVYLDRRMVPGENQAMALAEVQGVLDDLAQQDADFRAQVSVSRPDWQWEAIRQRGLNPSMSSPDSRVAQAVAAAHLAETGQEVTRSYTDGYNDGDFLNNDLGIPTVNYGPGESSRSHTSEEKLRLDQLEIAARVLLRSAVSLTG
jgi:acetylornithine deacetylase/succinyl-diaminopimelate desuccinylase-like protein